MSDMLKLALKKEGKKLTTYVKTYMQMRNLYFINACVII